MRYISITVLISVLCISLVGETEAQINKSIQDEIHHIEAYAQKSSGLDTIQVIVEEGWNLVSLPLIVPDNRVTVLFPNSVSNAFCYDGSYKPSDTLEVGKGYWLKFAEAETISIVGTLSTWDTLSLFPGWNMIGVIDYAVDINHLSTLPEGKLISGFYTYDSGQYHQVTDSLLPGIGYWIKVSDSCLVYPNFGKGGRIRLQNEIEHSGIFIFLTQRDTIFPWDLDYMTMTDSLGYFDFDSLPDGNWKLISVYPYYEGNLLQLSIFKGYFTHAVDFELLQFFKLWSEPAETTVSLQNNFCINLLQYAVNIWVDTISTSSYGDCSETIFGWIPEGKWPNDSCTAIHWTFYNGMCYRSVYLEFSPGDTFKKQDWTLCKDSFNDGLCFPGGAIGKYFIFSAPTDADGMPWFLNRRYVHESGDYYRPIYKNLNRSLSKKMKLFRPTIVNIIN